MEKKSLVNLRFGRLKVIKLNNKVPRITKQGKKKGNYYFYLCKCDCGNECIVQKENLQNGATQSCGCLQKEIATKNIIKISTKHGFAKHGNTEKLYKVWHSMKERCYNKKNKMYKYYGQRNITVCDEWKKDYINFRKWALNNGYRIGLDLDRIDNNGNYEPKNCRFISHKDNLMNRSNTIKININGILYSFEELSKMYNIKKTTLQTRYNRGKRDEKLIEPVRIKN